MGDRADPPQDAAAIVGIGQTEFCGRAEAVAGAPRGDLSRDTGALPVDPSGEVVPSGAVVLRAA